MLVIYFCCYFQTACLAVLKAHSDRTSPVPVAARSKAWVCGRSPTETVGSYPTGGMCLSVMSAKCCQIEVSATS